ncbi:hypothetical protein D4764_03G0009660 [Takifugu flavidus]|uniref:Uncharacterized protein n=1 Tax=Takifugu flavidus TaxID=433684 RepID=A0A5C6NAT0_9TELE|nr:hypothetical protein D4764_03G0009660 [Takifugu flavidus]
MVFLFPRCNEQPGNKWSRSDMKEGRILTRRSNATSAPSGSVAAWQRGTDRVGSGDSEAARCHLLCHWCTPLNFRLRIDGDGGYKDRLLWVVHNKKGSSCRT